MNNIFVKSILYTYSVIDDLCAQMDDLVVRRAVSSMQNFSPADKQFEKVITLTEQKKTLILVCKVLEEVMETLSEEERDLLDYKYFKKKPKSYYKDFDYLSRSYFRRQSVLVDKISVRFENRGINDAFIKEKCLSIKFFREMIKRVAEREDLANKNTPKRKMQSISTVKEEIKSLSAISVERQDEKRFA